MNLESFSAKQETPTPKKVEREEVAPGDPRRLVQDFLTRASLGDNDTQRSLDRLVNVLRDNYLKFARNKPAEIPEAGAISNMIRFQALELARQADADPAEVFNKLSDLVTDAIEKGEPKN